MQTGLQTAAPTANEREPIILTQRIGSTTFVINVETNPTAKETIADKIFRLIKSERESGKFLLQNMEACGTINLLRTVRLPGGSL